jgi:hypothetical protein
MECIELADGSRLGWDESQEFVAKVLGLLTQPAAVARVPWKPGEHSSIIIITIIIIRSASSLNLGEIPRALPGQNLT